MDAISVPSKLRLWEAALFLAFGLTLTVGMWAGASEGALADRVLRLHVVANSDSDSDQARKALVRDAVLALASQILEGVDDRREAEEALSSRLDELAEAGADVLARTGHSDPVRVTLSDEWFPTREYDGFSLPAGRYRALRVVIGEGAGRNWWCVVFPPLCLGAVSQSAEEAMNALPEGERALITGESEGYVLKFKLMELWDTWRRGLNW